MVGGTGEEKRPQGSVEAFVGLIESVFRFIHAYYPQFSAVLEEYRVNYSQYATLLTLYMYGSLTEGELARLVNVNPSTMSRMLYALEGRDWLKVTRDRADRRRVVVTLSPKGERQVKEMLRKPAEVIESLTRKLEAPARDEVYGMVEMIDRILQHLATVGEQAGS